MIGAKESGRKNPVKEIPAAGAPEVTQMPDVEIQATAVIQGIPTPGRQRCRCRGGVCETP
jgi:hypothetical protein